MRLAARINDFAELTVLGAVEGDMCPQALFSRASLNVLNDILPCVLKHWKNY